MLSKIFNINTLISLGKIVTKKQKKNYENSLFLYAEADLAGDIAELDESAEKDRRNKLRREDAVYTTNLCDMVRQALSLVEQHYGGAQAFQELCLSKVDPTVLDQVNKALTNQ